MAVEEVVVWSSSGIVPLTFRMDKSHQRATKCAEMRVRKRMLVTLLCPLYYKMSTVLHVHYRHVDSDGISGQDWVCNTYVSCCFPVGLPAAVDAQIVTALPSGIT